MDKRAKRIFWRIVLKQWEGVGVIEVILILVIIIGLVLIFREQIGAIIDSAFQSIVSDSDKAMEDVTITLP